MRLRINGSLLLAACVIFCACASFADSSKNEPGQWWSARKDSTNQARAGVKGKMSTAPSEIWNMPTGGEVAFARNVKVADQDAVLLHVGSTIKVQAWSGALLWERATIGVSRVMKVADFDGDKKEEAFIMTDLRTVQLLDVATGETLWSWQSEPSSFVSGFKFLETPTGIRFFCVPGYSLDGTCFDFSGDRKNPKLLWKVNYAGKFEKGYGPSIVLCDMDKDGQVDIVLSGKTPDVYNAVIDINTGQVKYDLTYDADPPNSYRCGRPYGLLHATDMNNDGFPDIAMLSCQVEEYFAIARNVEGKKIERVWGKYVEKDWPEDHKELRPHLTSFADVQGNGKVELIVGRWEENAWRTDIYDPLVGDATPRASLSGLYFWGCHDIDSDGVEDIIVSIEQTRPVGNATLVEALSGKSLQPVATLERAVIFPSSDSIEADDRAFMAIRKSPVELKSKDGMKGILVRLFPNSKDAGIFLWGATPGGAVQTKLISDKVYARCDVFKDTLILSDSTGHVQRFDEDYRPVGEALATSGRTCLPLVWSVNGSRQIVFDCAGDEVVGGVPDWENKTGLKDQWRVPGHTPALHVDSSGVGRLSVATSLAANIYTAPIGSASSPLTIQVSYPPYAGLMPYGDPFSLMVNLQTGVHTFAMSIYDASGTLRWQDTAKGAYPKCAAAGDLNGDGGLEVVSDDHGVMSIHDESGTRTAQDQGWPPAYTLPILGPFGPKGETRILRAGGIVGITLADASAKNLWKIDSPDPRLWRYYRSLPTVGDVAGDGRLALGALAEDGLFECIDAASGTARWSVQLPDIPNVTSVVSGDVDSDGRDEFLMGLPTGLLVCLAERNAQGVILWQKQLDASINNPILSDLDGDGFAEIILSTADGKVRALK